METVNLKNTESKKIIPGYKAKFVHSKNMTVVYWEIKAGFTLPEHSHIHEQISNVTNGEFKLIVDGISQILKPGIVTIIPSNAKHSGVAITDCEITDIFYPIREDYL